MLSSIRFGFRCETDPVEVLVNAVTTMEVIVPTMPCEIVETVERVAQVLGWHRELLGQPLGLSAFLTNPELSQSVGMARPGKCPQIKLRFRAPSSMIMYAGMWLTPVSWAAMCARPESTYGEASSTNRRPRLFDDKLSRVLALGHRAEHGAGELDYRGPPGFAHQLQRCTNRLACPLPVTLIVRAGRAPARADRRLVFQAHLWIILEPASGYHHP